MTPVSLSPAAGRPSLVPVSVPVPVPDVDADNRHPRVDGFTVAELVVSLALTSAIVLICSLLIVEAFRLVRAADHRLASTSGAEITASLRSDLHQAASLAGLAVGWQRGPLELVGWDGGGVRYQLDGDLLVRESWTGPGSPTVRRVLDRSVTAWWWRLVNEQTVEVRLTVGVVGSPGGGGRDRGTLERTFAIRGGTDGRSW